MNRLTGQLVSALRAHLAGGPPRVPEAGRVLWRLFSDLHQGRTWHGSGPNPISDAIEARARLMRWPLQPHHVAAIEALDQAWMEHATAPTADGKTAPRSSGQPLAPEVFDAIVG